MKWGASRRLGLRLRRSWVRILLVVAVGLSALAGGPSGRLPVVKAVTKYVYTGFTSTGVYSGTSGIIHYDHPLGNGSFGDAKANMGASYSASVSVDGVALPSTAYIFEFRYYWVTYGVQAGIDSWALRIFAGSWEGSHTFTWSVSGTWAQGSGVYSSWSGSLTGNLADGLLPPVPLDVSISGPGVVNTDDSHTWSATGSGGTGPYTYKWTYGATGPFFTYPYSGSTFSSKLAQGTWVLECQVTDSTGATAIKDLQVIASPGFAGAGYEITLTRSGTAGTTLTADARNVVNGLVASISNSSSSKVAWYTSTVPSTFTWYNLMAEGSAGSGFSWLWSLIVSGTPPIPAPPDTWFSSVLAVNGIQMTVVHHFVHINEIATLWFDSAGNCLNPETPPASGYQPPDWLKPLIDFLTYLFSPVIFVFEVIKTVINFAVGLIAYVSYVMGVVLSFAGLLARWLYVAVTTVFNFASASPGAYVSIGGLLSLVGFTDTGIAGDTSLFKGVGISASAMDVGLSKIHDWIMSPNVAWIWWGIFTFLLIRLVLNLGGGNEEGGDE